MISALVLFAIASTSLYVPLHVVYGCFDGLVWRCGARAVSAVLCVARWQGGGGQLLPQSFNDVAFWQAAYRAAHAGVLVRYSTTGPLAMSAFSMLCMSWSRMCVSLGGCVGAASSLRVLLDVCSSALSGVACTSLFSYVSITFSIRCASAYLSIYEVSRVCCPLPSTPLPGLWLVFFLVNRPVMAEVLVCYCRGVYAVEKLFEQVACGGVWRGVIYYCEVLIGPGVDLCCLFALAQGVRKRRAVWKWGLTADV
eukprot:1780812-Rhodomonas_salina.1